MMYARRKVKLPEWFKVGAEVHCIGEGDDLLTILKVCKNAVGDVTGAVLDHGCFESLSKIYHPITEERIYVAVGHCDLCKEIFPDSHVRHDIDGKNICNPCYRKKC